MILKLKKREVIAAMKRCKDRKPVLLRTAERTQEQKEKRGGKTRKKSTLFK
jgi:hypothetical protein